MLSLYSLAKWQTVVEGVVCGREREDCARMARCNVQLNGLDLRSLDIRIIHNNQQDFTKLELGRSLVAAGVNRAHQPLKNSK